MSFSFTVSFTFMSCTLGGNAGNRKKTLLRLVLLWCVVLKRCGDQAYLIWWSWRRSGVKGWTERTRAAQLTCVSQMCLSVWIKEPVAFCLFSFAPPAHSLTLPPHSLSGILALPLSIKLSLPCMSSLQPLLSCVRYLSLFFSRSLSFPQNITILFDS